MCIIYYRTPLNCPQHHQVRQPTVVQIPVIRCPLNPLHSGTKAALKSTSHELCTRFALCRVYMALLFFYVYLFHTMTFRHRGHYIFGLSAIHSSEAQNTIFPPVHGPLVHRTNPDHISACPSVRPSGEVSRHFPENALKNGLKFGILMYPDHLQN